MVFLRKSVQVLTNSGFPLRQLAKLHKTVPKFQETRQCEEIRIPVPWGHLAGKWWGPQGTRPVLCLHGWQDNCGTFDTLAPLLPNDLGLLTVDFPGHGLSSQVPKGMFYHGIDASIFIRRIQNYMGWSKLSLLGHSLGAVYTFLYTCLYPDEVDLLVTIDSLKPFSTKPGGTIKSTIENIEKFLRYDAINNGNTKPPSYTYDELINKLHIGIIPSLNKSISLESAKYILNRSIKQSDKDPNKFYFSRDSRLKAGSLIGMQHDDLLVYTKRVKCPMVVIKALAAPYFEDKAYFYDVIDVLNVNDNFEYVKVDGTHHVHLNEPEKVANILNCFFEKYDTGDRCSGGIKSEMKLCN